jgi:hypothetical protein
MGAAAMKEKKPDQAEMLAQLAAEVDLEHASPKAKALHQQLAASHWTAEDRAAGRELGREVQSMRAKELRAYWTTTAIRAFIDNFDADQILDRRGIVLNIHSACCVMGVKGKGGGNIKTDTISRWLTKDREDEIRLAAIRHLIERERNGWK